MVFSTYFGKEPYRRTTDAMLEYYQKVYREEARGQKAPDEAGKISIKNRKKLPLSQLRISPDGKAIRLGKQ